MTYTVAHKTTRMTATRDALNSGSLQLLGAGGEVIASYPLSSTAGTVANGVITFAGFPQTVSAANAGITIASARLRNSGGVDIKTGLTVGLSGSGAQIIVSKLTPAAGDTVTVAANPTLTHAA